MSTTSITTALPDHVRVAVIGTGFGGLGAGVKLSEAGISDFVLLERADAVGGTWRDNTYPGCACDVPSHLYSFSFAPNPEWSHSFSRQPEIRQYLEGIADRYRLRDRIYFGAEVTEARWDGDARCWQLDTARGRLRADVLVSAAGSLADPKLPDVPGLAEFQGSVFHSARWLHGAQLAGQRVAVVGTGASAIQIVPELQPVVSRLVLFQRTPAWVIPRGDRAFSRPERWLYRHVPAAGRLARLGIYASRECVAPAFTRQPRLLKAAQVMARRNLGRSISDPDLRAKLTPHYVMGCKRVLISSDFYPALAEPNVDVVASGLARAEGNTLVAEDGTRHDVDVVVLATGFHTVDVPIAERVFGADGRSLAEHWAGDMKALRGTTIAGFPNLCLVIGPNTGLGHTSMVHVIESQLAYIVDYVKALHRTGAEALDAAPAAEARWCAEVERRMGPTVWATGGCKSWYLNAAGRNTTLWPGTTIAFRRQTRRVDLSEYRQIREAGGKREPAPDFRPALPLQEVTVPSTDGVQLHAEIHGRLDGPIVVLVHGWANSTRVWAAVIRAIGDQARVVTYDHRGHGRSSVPARRHCGTEALVDDLSAVLEATVPAGERAVLVGHSMGGMTVMAAGSRPSVVARTSGAVLVSTGYANLPALARVVPVRSKRMSKAVHTQLLRSSLPIGPPTALSRAILRWGILGPEATEEVCAVNAEMAHASHRRSRGSWGRVLVALDVGDALAGLDVPVQVMVGTADRMTPPVHSELIDQKLPRSLGVIELPGIGHQTPLEAPDAVAEAILKVLAGTTVTD